jgi:hypothetical protein
MALLDQHDIDKHNAARSPIGFLSFVQPEPAPEQKPLTVGFLSLVHDSPVPSPIVPVAKDHSLNKTTSKHILSSSWVADPQLEGTLQSSSGRFTPQLAHEGRIQRKVKGSWKDIYIKVTMQGKCELFKSNQDTRSRKTLVLKKCSLYKASDRQFCVRRKAKEPIFFRCATEAETDVWIPTLAVCYFHN